MLNLFKARLPSRRAIISITLVLVLSYSAFIVGSGLTPEEKDDDYKFDVYWDTVGSGGDAIYSVASTANAASLAAADAAVAAEAARGAASPISSLFEVVSLSGHGFTGDDAEVEEFDEISAGRMVVYTAYMGLKVDDIDASLEQIKLLSVMHGGYVSSVNTKDERGSVSLRVPQSRFHDAIADLEELGEVSTRDLMGEDVTEEYVDLEAQLVSLRHQESRLFEIMEMGTTVDSVLKVERELERVRSRIESIQGRIKYLDSRVKLSTITVNLSELEVIEEITKAWFPSVDWSVPVRTGLGVLLTAAQGMVTMVIILGPFLALGYGGVRLFRWYRAGVPVEKAEEEEEL